jgi:O-antigen/teichoic acid export membrane protein
MLLTTIGAICIAFAVGAASIVYYTIPMSFAQRLAIVSATVAIVLFPKISESRGDLGASYNRLITKSHLLVAIVTGAMSSALVWAGNSGLGIWISPDFAERASGPLVALAIGFAAISISSVYHVNMDAMGRVKVTAGLTVASGVIGISACLLLALRYGETGGAIGIMVGLVLLATTVVLASAHYEHSPSRRDVGLTFMVVLVLFAVGSVAHFTMRVMLQPSSGRMWADALVTLSLVGLAGVALGRQLILREAPAKQASGDQAV